MIHSDRPIFQQIAEEISDGILRGTYPEGTQVPSTTELAVLHVINPATVGKGINLLVDAGILEKRRGLGMFVVEGAHARLVRERADSFRTTFIAPLVREARALGLTTAEIRALLDAESDEQNESSTSPTPPAVSATATATTSDRKT